MRIELPAPDARLDIYLVQVAHAGDLHIVLGADEIHALERPIRDHAHRSAP